MKKITSFFLILLITIIFFLISDYILSKTYIKKFLDKDCLKFNNYTHNNQRYYSYSLKNNCEALEVRKTVKSYKVYTNDYGFRVSKVQKTTKDNKIIFLGDSFTYGYGLSYEKSIPGYFQEQLKNFEIINLGVPGYGPSMTKHSFLKILKKKIYPNKVILILDLTDVYDESNKWIYLENYGSPAIVDKTITSNLNKNLDFKKNFKISNLLAMNLNRFFRDFRKDINKRSLEADSKIIKETFYGSFTYKRKNELDKNFWKNNLDQGLVKIKSNVVDISRIAKKYNAEFYIVIFPWAETLQYGEKIFSWQNFGLKLCQESNCNGLINLFASFEEYKRENDNWKNNLYFLNDIHLNENGNKIVAKEIIKKIFNK